MLQQGGSPQGVLEMLTQPDFHAHDQWQIQTQIQLCTDEYVHSDGLIEADIRRALLSPTCLHRDLELLLTATDLGWV